MSTARPGPRRYGMCGRLLSWGTKAARLVARRAGT